ncbi:MAG: FAD-dependent oxidoreductase [Candidatus Staskawiczbacteria bacterium]|nr:FAD-dependent oxidoreductase [Candidatus Staskawiczbacteria bacterium]
MVYDLIIIGSGPAGVAAAIYSARQKLNLLVISKDMGGQIGKKTVDIENYPGFDKISGPDLIKIFEEQLKTNKVEIIFEKVLEIDKKDNKFTVSTELGEKYESLAVIVATGADPRPLEAEGEKEFIGKGVSYCALCDGPIFKDKTVAVVGGGNSGFETALFLSNYVKKIYILEFGKVPKADQENQKLIEKNGKTEVITNAKVLKIQGDKFVKSLTYQDLISKEEKKIDVEGIFVEVGNVPATAFVKSLVDFSERDEIISDLETFATKTPGLFAAGDCNKGKYKQIVTATGEGATAALAAYDYLLKNKK